MFIEPNISGERRGWIEVICGSMFSGKTEELIRRLKRARIANLKVEIFKPSMDVRYHELQQLNKGSIVRGKNVAVILPSTQHIETGRTPNKNDKVAVSKQNAETGKEGQPQTAQKVVSEPEINFYDNAAVKKKPEENKEAGTPVTLSHTIEDFPTFTYQQKNAHELNDAMAQQSESLNDRLKVEKIELGTRLKETPVRDLRKAIGINDRFVFINELFRGDENMYERSIKTINSFNILAEAEYWIQRELKVKIGWNESSEIVKHFDQLVRRRFS